MNATKQSSPRVDALRRDIHIPRAFTAFLLWVSEILQDFRSPKQALINAFYNYVRKPINRITGAKVVIFCEMSKKNAVLGRFFVWRVGNYFRNVVNRFWKGVNFFRNQDNLIRKQS